MSVDTNAITKIKLAGHTRDGQVTAKLEGMGGGGEGLGDGEADEPSSQEAAESSTERERRRMLADLDRLKEMPDEVRREVAHMDMMGEYGSKVRQARLGRDWGIDGGLTGTADQLPHQASVMVSLNPARW
jgi:hypothetical protein